MAENAPIAMRLKKDRSIYIKYYRFFFIEIVISFDRVAMSGITVLNMFIS